MVKSVGCLDPRFQHRFSLFKELMEQIYKYLRTLKNVTLMLLVFSVILTVLHFPYDADAPLTPQEIKVAQEYYTAVYQKPVAKNHEKSGYETEYLRVAQAAADAYHIEDQVRAFVKHFNLNDRPVLEIGSGRGYLQDVAENYTGLDISPNVARFYHKKFIVGTATALPFPDDSFDGVWSIWVFEHVPNPEQAFREMRRVTRNNGVIFLLPAWNVDPWAAQGYSVRPYSDFGLVGKMIKATVPFRSLNEVRAAGILPVRLSRKIVAQFGPTALRYERLQPNYEQYWVPDSDAVNSIDSYEGALWFLSRGDECL